MTAPAPITANELLNAALGYAARGWPVFPLEARGKRPLTANGFKDASTDPAQVRAWWSRWPEANIGLPNGRAAGFVVVDVDGPEGEASLRALLPEVPQTPMVSTGKGGHLYFAYPPDAIVARKIRVRPGLDLCGEGGYVVAPPSVHPSGRAYTWRRDGALAPLPPAFLAPAAPERPTRATAATETVQEGARNATLTSLAGSMRRRGASEAAILAALHTMNAEQCSPPLSDRDVETIAASVARYEPATDTEHLTDLGNARRLVQRQGADLRHVKLWGSWLVWDGSRWVRDDTNEVERRAKTVVADLYAAAAALAPTNDTRAKELARWAGASSSAGRIGSMLDLAESEPEVAMTASAFDRDPWLLNVQNGTLDLRTGTLRPHTRSDYITKLAPVAFDAEASAPRWARFLDEIFAGDLELIAYVQRALGYSLTGDTREECLFFCYGPGRNGKSTAFELMQAILGDYARSASFDSFAQQHRSGAAASGDIARLHGGRFVQVSEAKGGRPLDTEILKRLTGRDTITARHLYQAEFEFTPQFKLWLRANHRPPVFEQTVAFWRRMRLVPFSVTIAKAQEDPNLRAALHTEAAGILNWLVAGCQAWLAHGLGDPPAVVSATEAYRAENDVIAEYLDACCVLDPDAWTSTAELYKRFETWWTETHGKSERVPGRSSFGRMLGEREDLQEKRTPRAKGWQGVTLQERAVDHEEAPF